MSTRHSIPQTVIPNQSLTLEFFFQLERQFIPVSGIEQFERAGFQHFQVVGDFFTGGILTRFYLLRRDLRQRCVLSIEFLSEIFLVIKMNYGHIKYFIKIFSIFILDFFR